MIETVYDAAAVVGVPTVIVTLGGIWMSYILRRRDKLADDRADGQDRRIENLQADVRQLMEAIAAEREARHASHKAVDDRVWAVNGDIKENYPQRVETNRMYGALCQKVDGHHAEVIEAIGQLPCRQPAVPAACVGSKTNDE